MKLRFASGALATLLVLVLGSAVVAEGRTPVTLNIVGGEPSSLDLSVASDSVSLEVIEQLFVGLVDLDDETSAVQPELATRWTISPDSTTYTFTLRSDATWSDGRPITAQDARYGILRSLDPSIESSYTASTLHVIQNAEAYATGAITDSLQVGVTAVDTTTLRVDLEHPLGHILSLLAQPVARPMPQWAIEAHGDTWTQPENIVTSGPYRLTEWVQDEHILLDKNPSFYDAADVQIEHVKMWMEDGATAWTMYLDGQLDTATVPLGTELEPVVSQQVHTKPDGCTYYYGFSVSQPPFTSTLVRKAFAASIDRRELINVTLGGGRQPALTLTPPGLFGHIDGATEGIGIPYDPSQAMQWLADAGYPDGQGLPPVTLWFNTSQGHQTIAEYVRDSWHTVLGVTVTLQSLPWSEYNGEVGTGQSQIWKGGWCPDYHDPYNFLHDAVIPARSSYGNWMNATYDGLLNQALQEPDPNVRKTLYRQAEEILVEDDAVLIPVYYFATNVAAKPYLYRTYGTVPPDISTWRIMRRRLYLPLSLRD